MSASAVWIGKLVEKTRDLLLDAQSEYAEADDPQAKGELAGGVAALSSALTQFDTALAYARGEEVVR